MLTLDASTTSSSVGTGNSQTFSHTIGTGRQCGLFVIAILKAGSSAAHDLIATYNSVSMTKLGEVQSLADAVTIAVFYLVAPATGAHNVYVNWTNSAAGQFIARSYFSVHQGQPVLSGSWTTGTFNSTTPSISVPSRGGDIVMDGLGYGYTSPSTATAGAGQTAVMNIEANSVHSSASVEAGSATVTMSWTVTNPRNGVQVGFSIHSSSGSGGVAISPSLIF